MLNKALLRFGIVFCICLIGIMADTNVFAQSPKKNWGIRLGLNAVSITSYKAYQADETLANSSYTNKNGYLLAGFTRFNMNRVFLQPEIAWNEYRRTCSFSLPIDNSNYSYPPINLDIDSKAVNTGLLAGYNIVYDYPFLFGIYAGTSVIGTYRTNYSMEMEKTSPKTDWSLNCSGILGFSINISRIYFDLRYEMCLPHTVDLNRISDFPTGYQDVKIKKAETILSFSFGVMF